MSVSKKVNAVKFLDQLMRDNKWRSRRQMVAALAATYAELAEQEVSDWFNQRDTFEDHGLRSKRNGKSDNLYWRIQPPEKRWTGTLMPKMNWEEVLRQETECAFDS
jgi:hypothetical protein